LTLPALAFAHVSRAVRVRARRALAALGRAARDTLRRGVVAAKSDPVAWADAIAQPLADLGMDRAVDVAREIACATGSDASSHLRGLARALCIAHGASRYPDGPAPRAAIEAALRARCRPGERGRAPGRVLIPLVDDLVWDLAAHRLVQLPVLLPMRGCVVLARRMEVDLGHPLPICVPTSVLPGVPLGRGSDRRMLRSAEGSLARVASAYATSLADPLADEAPVMLVGPLRFVRRSAQGGDSMIVEDAGGLRAALRWPIYGECPPFAKKMLHVLAQPVACHGHLGLVPRLVWLAGDRHAVLAPRVDATPWGDSLLTDLWKSFGELAASGLAARYTDRATVRGKVPYLRAAGYARLAALIDCALPETGADDALAFAGAALMTRALLHSPRWLQGGGS
jgi:hypothetical protein